MPHQSFQAQTDCFRIAGRAARSLCVPKELLIQVERLLDDHRTVRDKSTGCCQIKEGIFIYDATDSIRRLNRLSNDEQVSAGDSYCSLSSKSERRSPFENVNSSAPLSPTAIRESVWPSSLEIPSEGNSSLSQVIFRKPSATRSVCLHSIATLASSRWIWVWYCPRQTCSTVFPNRKLKSAAFGMPYIVMPIVNRRCGEESRAD